VDCGRQTAVKPEETLKPTGKSDDLRDSLRKERRLLILSSLVLIAHVGFGLTVERGADTLGLKFQVRNPGDVWIFVSVVWAWALVRYSLFFGDYIDDDMLTEVKRREYWTHEWVATRRARKLQLSEGLIGRPPNPSAVVMIDLGDTPKEGFAGTLHYDVAHVTVITPNEAGGTDSGGAGLPQRFEPAEVRLIRCYAWAHLAVTTRYGTEYFVPFALGLSPVVAMIWKHLID
jgi:hypothetical protein